MTFGAKLLIGVALIGAIVGFIRSDGDKFSDRVLGALGGAFVALLIAGAVVMVPNIGSGSSEDSDISDSRQGR